MQLQSVHIKPHYSQNAFDSALLAWYERGISSLRCTCHIIIIQKYTEHQKKLFLRAMLTKIHCIKINHVIWKQICYSSPYEAHLKNQRVAFAKKEKDAMNSQKVIFQKSQKLLREPLQKAAYSKHSTANHSISMACYVHVTDVLAFNCPCRTLCLGDEQFLWFLKSDLLRFHPISLLFDSSKWLFFYVLV